MNSEDLKSLGKGIVNNDIEWIDFIDDEDLKSLGKGIVNNDIEWINLI